MHALGSNIALETADIILLEEDFTRLNASANITISVLIELAIVILAARGTISLLYQLYWEM